MSNIFNLKCFLLISILSCFILACESETCVDGILNQDEVGIDCGGVCAACITCVDGLLNGDEEDIDCGGSNCPVCETCTDGIQNRDEEDIDCGGRFCDVCLVGGNGIWESSGSNVARLLSNFFSIDSLVADYRTDNTYTIYEYNKRGQETILEGTYAQVEISDSELWTIQLNQETPEQKIYEGILQLVDENTLILEMIQTLPDVGESAPTVTDGFRSTSNGYYGGTNVQTFVRL